MFLKSDVQSCTPSRKDGIDMVTETRYRREGAKLIVATCTKHGHRTISLFFGAASNACTHVYVHMVKYKKALTKVYTQATSVAFFTGYRVLNSLIIG